MSADNGSDAGLVCFGRMTASVSHEFKNHLATIREKAGLLTDLLTLAARGREVDFERLAGIAADIQQRTADADAVVKRLNAFAHSTDNPLAEVPVDESVELTLNLYARLAAMRGVSFDLQGDAGVVVSTRPFLLMQLLLACLDAVMDSVEDGAQVTVTTRATQEGAEIVFSAGGGGQASQMAELLDALSATAVAEAGSGLVLRLPKNV